MEYSDFIHVEHDDFVGDVFAPITLKEVWWCFVRELFDGTFYRCVKEILLAVFTGKCGIILMGVAYFISGVVMLIIINVIPPYVVVLLMLVMVIITMFM